MTTSSTFFVNQWSDKMSKKNVRFDDDHYSLSPLRYLIHYLPTLVKHSFGSRNSVDYNDTITAQGASASSASPSPTGI